MSNKNQIAIMADRLNVDAKELQSIVMNTVMPTGNNAQRVTNEQFVSFLAVANEYKLNPMTKEIYAFPAKGGGIQPIVSIDGWMKIINSHPEFDGMTFQDNVVDGSLISVTCRIHRKDRSHPIEVTEYMDECRGTSEPWKRWPSRMLRHKSAIQGGRYAFGLSGIVDPDEAERIQSAQEKDMGRAHVVSGHYPDADFEQNFPKWLPHIESGKLDVETVLQNMATKGGASEAQKLKIEQAAAAAKGEAA